MPRFNASAKPYLSLMAMILGIESSCDETAASVCTDAQIRSNVVSSQLEHAEYGGVIPEIASREHLSRINRVVQEALKQADVRFNQLDAIAVTSTPGLLGSLLVGISYAKGLSASLNIPLMDIHHMQAHIMALYITDTPPEHPFLCLTVSGGHTQLVRVDAPDQMTILGNTRDDAAGEAFDKIGKMLGLSYPCGPQLDKLAQQGKATVTLPIPGLDGLDFSFSGMKTAMLYHLRDAVRDNPDYIEQNLTNLCASTQAAIVEALVSRVDKAAQLQNIKTIGIAGGVSANSALRAALKSRDEWTVHLPPLQYTTDNAAMIAMAGHFKYGRKEFADLTLMAKPRSGF